MELLSAFGNQQDASLVVPDRGGTRGCITRQMQGKGMGKKDGHLGFHQT